MKEEIINIALENLQNQMEIHARWDNNGPLDGILTITINGKELLFVTEIKKELRHYHVNQFEQFQQQKKNLIIVAEHIFPRIKEELRQRNIAYIEANGNVFIKEGDIFCFIDTNKKQATKKAKTNRAFTKAGLKVVFHLLLDKDLINTNQRNIAELTGVALGNIPQIIDGLKEQGFLIPFDKKKFVWENREELLNRWINEYATVLKPKLKKVKYQIQGNWQYIPLNTNLTVWGGEPAADILTNHLRPEKFIFYTKETNLDLIKNYKLIPKNNGELEAFEMFWNNNNFDKTAPPLLIYTELILEGGKRNKETANMIYDEYIQANL